MGISYLSRILVEYWSAIAFIQPYISTSPHVDLLTKRLTTLPFIFRLVNYLYNKLSKGVSIVSYQLPYTLQLVPLYPITTNSKAA